MKPFCSGGTKDVELIRAIQGQSPSAEEVNPFYFAAPVAPLVAARMEDRKIGLSEVLRRIRAMQRRCDCLLIEGAGGVLVPVGENFMIADLITRLRCEVLVVARDRIGTVNHTLLSVESLRKRHVKRIKVILMGKRREDPSAKTNASILRETLGNIDVFSIPYLGAFSSRAKFLKQSVKKMKKVLVRVLDFDIVCPRSLER